jgi:hypothetical protein
MVPSVTTEAFLSVTPTSLGSMPGAVNHATMLMLVVADQYREPAIRRGPEGSGECPATRDAASWSRHDATVAIPGRETMVASGLGSMGRSPGW